MKDGGKEGEGEGWEGGSGGVKGEGEGRKMSEQGMDRVKEAGK